MSKNIGLISLGCPKNLVDSEIMLGLLEKDGYHIVTDPAKADVLIVNTCGFVEDAKRESIEAVLEMAHFKEKGRAKHLIVTGCLPQRYKDELLELFPEVDLFVGTGEYHRIVEFIEGLQKGTHGLKEDRQYIGVPEYIHTARIPRKLATPRHAVYVKIAEGCFHACSFCTIPKVRGKYRSRAASDIILEVKELIKNGAKELNLIAQDTTAYGRDLKEKEDIVTLLEKITQLSGEKWVRILYAYPQSFKKGIIGLMKEHPEICRYIDIPIQHIDDDILLSMRRGRSERAIRELVEYIKKEIPEAALRTTLIIGYPGETEARFKKLFDFIGEGWFDHVGVFAYSEEEGTAAAKMKGHVSSKVKEERRREIMRLQKKISKKKLCEKIGKKLKVLIEGVSPESEYLLQGRSEFQAPDIDGVVYINDHGRGILRSAASGGPARDDLTGRFYNVEITDTYDYDMVGKVV